jgi:hypothetical protein
VTEAMAAIAIGSTFTRALISFIKDT